jgi:Tol biopolymer transport system component
MGEGSAGISPSIRSPEDRLDSWKEIAAYLNRDVTTVQRWEKREGMPVHRHVHDRAGSVYAFREELDAWSRSRNPRPAPQNGNYAPLATPQMQPEKAVRRVNRKFALLLSPAAALVIGVIVWLQRSDSLSRSPIIDARFQTITNFDGMEQAAAVSRDGHFVAFLSDRGGQMDVWVTQAGSGQFHNLTRGSVPGLVNNPFLRGLAFSPDGSLVTFWLREGRGSGGSNIGVWAVPTLGGEPKPYLEGVAEFEWTRDGSRLAYHTPGAGDPLFVSDGRRLPGRRIFTAPAGQHSHYQLWSPDATFLYFVLGTLPDKLDVWRIPAKGGTPERITSHNARVSHPVLLDRRRLLYLASNPDGSGPSLYGMDVEHRIAHKLTTGPDVYTSLAATADGRRLVLTLSGPKRSLWRLQAGDSPKAAVPVPLTTSTGFSPRLGPDFLLYVSGTGTGESIWKLANGASSELWRGEEAQIIGGPAISPDGRRVAFSVRQNGQALLYVMGSDGTKARMVCDSLNLQGSPAWAASGESITSAADDHGVPHIFRVPLDGGAPAVFVKEYSVDPAWAPDGRFVIYSGPDIGTTFSVKAVTAQGAAYPLQSLVLTRGARRMVFESGGRALVFLRGDIRHKDLWRLDLGTGAQQELTNFGSDFDIRDFDISPDGREVVVERVQERSDVVMADLARR